MANPLAWLSGRMTTAKWLSVCAAGLCAGFGAGRVTVTEPPPDPCLDARDSLDACREREGACYDRLDRCYDKDVIAGMRDDWTAAVRRAEDAAE